MLFSDTCGLVSVAIVYLSYLWISYIGISIGFLSIYSNPEVPVSIFLFLVILSLSSHMVAMLSDPGKITSQATPLRSSGIPCISCNCIKPPRAHHCKTCEKCILNMDHHCPWINNCVGFRNQKHFVLFLAYTFISTVWVIITFLQKIYICQYQDCFSKENPFDPLLIMLGCFWCLFFALMTCVSLYEQIKVIKHNISEIDIWQSRKFKQVRVI